MPTYILLSKLTEAGRKTVKKKPARTKEVNKEIEAMGGKVLAQYAVLGPYDYVSVVEARDNETIARISMELGSRVTVAVNALAEVVPDGAGLTIDAGATLFARFARVEPRC